MRWGTSRMDVDQGKAEQGCHAAMDFARPWPTRGNSSVDQPAELKNTADCTPHPKVVPAEQESSGCPQCLTGTLVVIFWLPYGGGRHHECVSPSFPRPSGAHFHAPPDSYPLNPAATTPPLTLRAPAALIPPLPPRTTTVSFSLICRAKQPIVHHRHRSGAKISRYSAASSAVQFNRVLASAPRRKNS